MIQEINIEKTLKFSLKDISKKELLEKVKNNSAQDLLTDKGFIYRCLDNNFYKLLDIVSDVYDNNKKIIIFTPLSYTNNNKYAIPFNDFFLPIDDKIQKFYFTKLSELKSDNFFTDFYSAYNFIKEHPCINGIIEKMDFKLREINNTYELLLSLNLNDNFYIKENNFESLIIKVANLVYFNPYCSQFIPMI